MNELQQLLELKPLVLVMVALNVLGLVIKRQPWMPNWTIPLILPIAGTAVVPFLGLHVTFIDMAPYPKLIYALIGFVCGGQAVWGNQVWRQVTGQKAPTIGNGEIPPSPGIPTAPAPTAP